MSPGSEAAATARSTGLVLTEAGAALDGAPVAHLERLRRSEASRLLKRLASTGERAIATTLRDLGRSAPTVAADVLLAPAAAVLARTDRVEAARDLWALELARRALLGQRYVVDGRSLCSPALGVAVDWGDDVRVALEDGALEVEGRGARVARLRLDALSPDVDPRLRIERAYVPLASGVTLALHDTNPLSMLEAHPDKAGNACSLGGRVVDEWTTSARAALALVERHVPVVCAELRTLATLLVPVGYEPVKHLSASYREYIGASYLTLHPDVHTMAEAIVHEHQHNKANLASYHDVLLENALDTMVRSPVRPDLRPIWGVLLAVHAFVPVAELYARMLAVGEMRVRDRFVDVVGRNDEGLRTVREHGRPTRIGAAIILELEALHATHLSIGGPAKKGVDWEA